ncbi:MAG: nucleoside hydrolase [Clostridia bacterium]|nr:nucleoside hydrolase [Clostridia bacterium]
MNHEQLLHNLNTPKGVVDVLLDTDAYNEIDDQFAISYAMLSPERIRVVAICAAPFHNPRSNGPEDGMERSYDEILKLLRLMDREAFAENVYRGSRTYLPDETTPVISPAAEKIVEFAKDYSPENPLYIVALGAITNVASAILLDRETMVNNTVVVWLGGHALHWKHNAEFNMKQDVAGARVLFGCGVPLVILPCQGVVSALTTTKGELTEWLSGSTPLGEYLMNNTIEEAESYAKGTAWSRCIWDVSAVAWLMNDEDRLMYSYLTAAPIPQYDHYYSLAPTRHPIRYVYGVKRDAIFTDLFRKLRG